MADSEKQEEGLSWRKPSAQNGSAGLGWRWGSAPEGRLGEVLRILAEERTRELLICAPEPSGGCSWEPAFYIFVRISDGDGQCGRGRLVNLISLPFYPPQSHYGTQEKEHQKRSFKRKEKEKKRDEKAGEEGADALSSSGSNAKKQLTKTR